MNKIWQDEAWEDFEYWTKHDRRILTETDIME